MTTKASLGIPRPQSREHPCKTLLPSDVRTKSIYHTSRKQTAQPENFKWCEAKAQLLRKASLKAQKSDVLKDRWSAQLLYCNVTVQWEPEVLLVLPLTWWRRQEQEHTGEGGVAPEGGKEGIRRLCKSQRNPKEVSEVWKILWKWDCLVASRRDYRIAVG